MNIRTRVGGICVKDNKILLIRHRNVGELPVFWLPPGGAIQYGESLEEALQREFIEETGLTVVIKQYLFANEVLVPHVHTLEFFFEVQIIEGELITGQDPEFSPENQLIEECVFLSFEEIKAIPPLYLHNLFWEVNNIEELLSQKGLLQLIR
jgi:8-oxo-dGTP pyrophosphatase MutT (NUDIX family)